MVSRDTCMADLLANLRWKASVLAEWVIYETDLPSPSKNLSFLCLFHFYTPPSPQPCKFPSRHGGCTKRGVNQKMPRGGSKYMPLCGPVKLVRFVLLFFIVIVFKLNLLRPKCFQGKTAWVDATRANRPGFLLSGAADGSRPLSRSLRVCPWTSICFMTPSSKFLDLLPPPPLPPAQKKTGRSAQVFATHWGAHTEKLPWKLLRFSEVKSIYWGSFYLLS